MNGTSFLILDCWVLQKLSKLKSSLVNFSFSGIRFLNISVFYMQVPYKMVPYKKCVHCFQGARPFYLTLRGSLDANGKDMT